MKKEKTLIDTSKLLGKEKLLKLLFRILKGHKCYVSFKKNTTPSKLKNIAKANFSYYDPTYNLIYVAELINQAFTWVDTKEGRRYWYNIYDKLSQCKSMPKTLTYRQFKLIFTNK